MQAYIFTMLSALFIGMGVAMGHHDDHDEHARHHEGARATTTARPTAGPQLHEFSRAPVQRWGPGENPAVERPPEVVQMGHHDPPTSGSNRQAKKKKNP